MIIQASQIHEHDLDEFPENLIGTEWVPADEHVSKISEEYRKIHCSPWVADAEELEWNGYEGCAFTLTNGFEIWHRESTDGEFKNLPEYFLVQFRNETGWVDITYVQK